MQALLESEEKPLMKLSNGTFIADNISQIFVDVDLVLELSTTDSTKFPNKITPFLLTHISANNFITSYSFGHPRNESFRDVSLWTDTTV